MTSSLCADAESIFRAALDRVDPVRMVMDALRLTGDHLAPELGGASFDLTGLARVVVTGMGKASVRELWTGAVA
jgi:glycerate-2-kinase